MRTVLVHSLSIVLAAVRLIAADPVWMTKPAADWTEEDASQVLARSPWARQVKATITRRLTEDELREGGQMGQPRGLGNEGVDPKGNWPTLSLRWESSLPIRLAELKARDFDPPTLEGDGYGIAVYGIPGTHFSGDPEKLGAPLKAMAVLKREGKKDARPASVEVFQRENDVVVVYLFPLSTEIVKNDGTIRFEAQIGRIVVAHTFDLTEMNFQGNLAL